MKKFTKNSIFLLFSLILISCSKTDTSTANDTGYFYDVVYQTVATRENSNLSWVGVSGVMQMKISQSTDTEGTFIFFYQSYKEPQFVYNVCSGGFKGNFVIPETTSTTTSSSNGYNVFTPYVPEGGSTNTSDTTSTGETVSVIQSYQFQLSINFRSLDPACRTESDRTIGLSRFSNGEVILKNEYRELLMRPVLTSESQIK